MTTLSAIIVGLLTGFFGLIIGYILNDFISPFVKTKVFIFKIKRSLLSEFKFNFIAIKLSIEKIKSAIKFINDAKNKQFKPALPIELLGGLFSNNVSSKYLNNMMPLIVNKLDRSKDISEEDVEIFNALVSLGLDWDVKSFNREYANNMFAWQNSQKSDKIIIDILNEILNLHNTIIDSMEHGRKILKKYNLIK